MAAELGIWDVDRLAKQLSHHSLVEWMEFLSWREEERERMSLKQRALAGLPLPRLG